MGELATAVYYAKHLGEIRVYEQEHPDIPSYQAELAILGFDHQELGAEVLNHWHLPQLYIEMARHHHNATYAVDTCEGMMVALVQSADQLAAVLKEAAAHLVTSGQGQQEGFQEPLKAAIATIKGVPPGIVEKLEKDIGKIGDEAKAMIEQSGT